MKIKHIVSPPQVRWSKNLLQLVHIIWVLPKCSAQGAGNQAYRTTTSAKCGRPLKNSANEAMRHCVLQTELHVYFICGEVQRLFIKAFSCRTASVPLYYHLTDAETLGGDKPPPLRRILTSDKC